MSKLHSPRSPASWGAQSCCDDCSILLTVLHLLFECASLADLREQFLSRCWDTEKRFSSPFRWGRRLSHRSMTSWVPCRRLFLGSRQSLRFYLLRINSFSLPVFTSRLLVMLIFCFCYCLWGLSFMLFRLFLLYSRVLACLILFPLLSFFLVIFKLFIKC